MNYRIEVRLKTGENFMQNWRDIHPLLFDLQKLEYTESFALQVLANAKKDRPNDKHIEVRWNRYGSHQGHYIN